MYVRSFSPFVYLFVLHNPNSLKRKFQLRVGFSYLNPQEVDNISDSVDNLCDCCRALEDTFHYLFHRLVSTSPRGVLIVSVPKNINIDLLGNTSLNIKGTIQY